MNLFNQQELAAIASVFNRAPLSPLELVGAQILMQRLVAFCALPGIEKTGEPETDAALADALDLNEEGQAPAVAGGCVV